MAEGAESNRVMADLRVVVGKAQSNTPPGTCRQDIFCMCSN